MVAWVTSDISAHCTTFPPRLHHQPPPQRICLLGSAAATHPNRHPSPIWQLWKLASPAEYHHVPDLLLHVAGLKWTDLPTASKAVPAGPKGPLSLSTRVIKLPYLLPSWLLWSQSLQPLSRKDKVTSRLIWSSPSCDPIHRMSGSQQQGSACRLCFLSLKRTWWLNYKERCSEAEEVSCVAAGPRNENLAWKDKCVVNRWSGFEYSSLEAKV